jgi:energy-coupling factor transport system substrate-specific component
VKPLRAAAADMTASSQGWLRRHLLGLLACAFVCAGTLLVVRGIGDPAAADWSVTSLLVVTALLLVGVAASGARLVSAHQLALVAALAAFATASRLLFASLPNFKPVTFIVLTAGVALGPAPGFLVGATTALISNLFFGQGPWTPWQMLAWGAVGAAGGLLGLGRRTPGRWELVLAGGALAVAFDWFVTLWMYLSFTAHTWPALLALYAQGLLFDASHATATCLFAALFGPRVVQLIARFRRRTEVVFLPLDTGTDR